MQVMTKYDIGHEFWVPRSFKRYGKETIEHLDKEWTREVVWFEHFAKKKIVKQVQVVFTENGTSISYYVINANSENEMSQVYLEDRITSMTEEEAEDLAASFAFRKLEYYGTAAELWSVV